MRCSKLSFKFVFASLVLVFLCGSSIGQQDVTWQKDLATWRTQHVADLKKPAGWLSLTGLEWLQPGDNSFGSAADNKIHLVAGNPAHLGILHLENNVVKLLPPSSGFAPEFLVAGTAATEEVIPVDLDNDKNAPHL